MTIGGMLHAKLPRGSPLRDFMYSSAEPHLQVFASLLAGKRMKKGEYRHRGDHQ